MRIVQLQAENVKKLKAIQIKPEGNVIKITGANEQGKTTVLDCIWMALGGKKAVPEVPIRKGEKTAKIMLDIGDLVITRSFTEANDYIKVENKQGAQFKSPQGILDKLIGKYSFDPLAFSKADKKTQVNTLLELVNIAVDENKLQEISGVKVARTENPLDMLNAAYKTVFDNRTIVNREVEAAKGALLTYGTDIEKTEPISASELMAEKDELERQNRENQKKRDAVENQLRAINALKADENKIVSEIEQLEQRIQQLKDALSGKQAEITEAEASYQTASQVLETLIDNDLTDIKERIRNADETNRKANTWKEWQRAQATFEGKQNESNALTDKLTKITAYKNELVKSAKFPIEGLDFGNGGVLYQGLPFEQASSAQKLQVSLAIAMALNPDLRVIRIDDGSLLDKKHMAIIEEMAKENDFQIWMECVDESGKVGVYIEDGEVARDNLFEGVMK